MSLETTWFVFEIEFADADSMVDKIPAETESEARATIGRIYSTATSVRLVETEKKEALFANFRPGMSGSRRITVKRDNIISVNCPNCGGLFGFRKDREESQERCPHCGSRYKINAPEKGVFVVSPVQGRATPPSPKAPSARKRTSVPWHELLEVSPEADIREIRTAYLQQVRLYHPDKVSHLGPDLQKLAEAKTAEVNAALEAALRAKKG